MARRSSTARDKRSLLTAEALDTPSIDFIDDSARTRAQILVETFEHAGVGIARIDRDGRFFEVNQKFCDMLGYSREELVGLTSKEITHADDYGPGPALRKAAKRGGATVLSGEKRYIRKDGSILWARRTMSLVLDERGELADAISIVEDITERKNAEEAARSERLLLRTIIDAVPHYIYVKDVEGRFTLANKAWLEARGLSADEVRGKSVYDVFPGELANQMEAQDKPVFAGTPLYDVETRIAARDADGNARVRWSLSTKVPLRDDVGRITGIVGISRDITARRRLEQERALEHAVAKVLSESLSVEATMPRLLRTMCEAMGWAYGARWVWNEQRGSLLRAECWSDFTMELDGPDREAWLEVPPTAPGRLIRRTWRERKATWVADVTPLEHFRRAATCARYGLRSAFAFPIVSENVAVGVLEFFGRDVREPDEAQLEVSGAIASQIGQFISRKQAEESLQENEQQLRAMFENANVGIAVTDIDARFLRANDKYCSIVGYAREELLSMRAYEVNLDSNVDLMREQRERMMQEGSGSLTVEKQLVRKDGDLVWVSIANSVVRGIDGTPRYFISVTQDISESRRAAEALKQSEEEFRKLAQYDSLTGLPNRGLFYDRLRHSLAQAKRNQWSLAVLFIDVDRFKHVNDTFGHGAGDELLKQVATRLASCVRDEDTVGRLGGDEFAMVLSHLTAPSDAATVAAKIVDQLNRPFPLEGTEVFVTASIGITVYPTDSTDLDTLLRNADVAMYRAKDRGRNNFQFYTPEMNNRTREMLNLAAELRRAIDRDEFVLHYQPKVSLASRRIAGLEALLRWRHPERGLVSPADFIPLLEETGLVVQAGNWVLRAVCRQLCEWRRAGLRLVPVAVNLSARQFLAPDLGSTITALLTEHAVEPGLLEVEITESSIMTDTELAIRTLEYLHSLGVHSAIDDFGTGYSSLGYLKRFPVRALKIDRSFVSDIDTDSDDATITHAVISMAHSLGVTVIAEGVETEAQLAFLMRYGCDEVQGYLCSQPLPAKECAALLADDTRIRAILEAVKTPAT